MTPFNFIDFNNAVESHIRAKLVYKSAIKKASMYADILATEYFVCAGIGFIKYLN